MQIKVSENKEKQSEGLKDGGHIYLSCSNCRAILMDIWITRPHESQTWKVKALCPFCGDSSFVIDVKGGFHHGGYGRVKEDDAEDDFPSTVIDGCEIVNETFIFKMAKAKEDAKPLYR